VTRRFLLGCLWEVQAICAAPGAMLCAFGVSVRSPAIMHAGSWLARPGDLVGRLAWRYFGDLID
jgi:hypothetical protein